MQSLIDLMADFDRLRAIEAKGFRLVKVGDAFGDWSELHGNSVNRPVRNLGEAEAFVDGFLARNAQPKDEAHDRD